VAQHLAFLAPANLRRCLVICAGHAASPQSSAWRHVQRQILKLGMETGQEFTALKLARSLAICGYRSEREFSSRFKAGVTDGPESVTAYLDYCSEKFASGFDIFSYLCLSASIDSHQFNPDQVRIPVDLLGFNSDQLVPVHQLIKLRKKLGPDGKLILKPSLYGHDAFLKERQLVATVISDHLEYPL
jgi:homoserine O-acetyltransferase